MRIVYTVKSVLRAIMQYAILNTNLCPTHFPSAYCNKANCHKYCPNLYTAYRPVPLKIVSTPSSERIINAVEVPKHTLDLTQNNCSLNSLLSPFFEASGTIIYNTPTTNAFQITSHHHFSILTTHPAILHMIQDTSTNCVIRRILIPDPTPHLKLFVITLHNIPPTQH